MPPLNNRLRALRQAQDKALRDGRQAALLPSTGSPQGRYKGLCGQKSEKLILALGAAVLSVLLLLFSTLSPASAREKLMVTASILPLADFTRQVGGEYVSVEVLVQPGQNPHLINFNPSQLKKLNRSRLLVLNGLGLEYWADKLVKALDNPGLEVLYCGEGLEKSHNDSQGQDPHGLDPHVWLDPLLAMEQVKCIREGLIRADPPSRGYYENNTANYLTHLKKLHGEFSEVLADARGRTFISFHGGYGHLARRYGIKEIGVVEGFSELEPSPARLSEVIRAIRRTGIKVIFAEPQFSNRAAQAIAEETGSRVAILDALGSPGRMTYLEMMRWNLTQLSQALLN